MEVFTINKYPTPKQRIAELAFSLTLKKGTLMAEPSENQLECITKGDLVMSCGMFDQWELIHAYTRQDAIADGVLVPYTFTHNRRKLDACFSSGLYEKYKAHPSSLRWIAQRGMQLLAQHDPQDDDIRKLRVILANQIWVIADQDGITFLQPEDY